MPKARGLAKPVTPTDRPLPRKRHRVVEVHCHASQEDQQQDSQVSDGFQFGSHCHKPEDGGLQEHAGQNLTDHGWPAVVLGNFSGNAGNDQKQEERFTESMGEGVISPDGWT
ncbi:MAG: hypothetical protein C4293_06955, partial [Nitrospiraceae bacterium]